MDSDNDDRFGGIEEDSLDNSEEEELEEEEEIGRISPEAPVKRKKPGVIYLSSVPDGMNVSQTTAFFSEFGRVGRVFLQPDKTDKQKGKYNRVFSEGWIEFMSKKVARTAAERLNCQPVGGKRRSKAHDQIWNIKYLPRFKWIHLSERLAYEAAVRQQRLRAEISQVKREAEHFKSSVDSKRKKSRTGAGQTGEQTEQDNPLPFLWRQKETEAQLRKRKIDEKLDQDLVEPVKKKKAKKTAAVHHRVAASGHEKTKVKGKKLEARSKGKSGDRAKLLKSVFGGPQTN